MNEEQTYLMARILNALCQEDRAIIPCVDMGLDVGQCRFCGMEGQVQGYYIEHRHTADCPVTLNEQLQQSL